MWCCLSKDVYAGNMVKQRTIAVIPTRGGSKRLTHKNILPVNCRPMISYPIKVAIQSCLFAEVIISTEDPEIVAIAKSCGATISHRDENLAQNRSTVVQVCADLLARHEYMILISFVVFMPQLFSFHVMT